MRVTVDGGRTTDRSRFGRAAVALALGLIAAAFSVGLSSARANTTVAAKPRFSRGIGAVLPSDGAQAEVSVFCPESTRGACHGSIALAPRGGTARTLGSRAVARRSVTLARGADADLKLRLSARARAALSHGPLFVTAILRGGRSGSTVATRQVAVARERRYTAPGRVVMARAANAGSEDFTWSWTIPAAHYLVMKKFSCPSNYPVLDRGSHQALFNKLGIGSYRDAKLEVKASDGTGYAGFDRPELGPGVKLEVNYYRYMAGWPIGGLLYNSIWAPLGSDGHFALTVACTTKDGYPARLGEHGPDPDDPYYKEFFPWKWSEGG
jgi:hypothetical protein